MRSFENLYCITSLNYAFPLLQSVLVLPSGQQHIAFCSSHGPVWSSASMHSPSQALPLGATCLTVFGAHQHVTSLNSVWRLISSVQTIVQSLVSVELLRMMFPFLSVRRPCNVHWRAMAPYKLSYYYYYYYYCCYYYTLDATNTDSSCCAFCSSRCWRLLGQLRRLKNSICHFCICSLTFIWWNSRLIVHAATGQTWRVHDVLYSFNTPYFPIPSFQCMKHSSWILFLLLFPVILTTQWCFITKHLNL